MSTHDTTTCPCSLCVSIRKANAALARMEAAESVRNDLVEALEIALGDVDRNPPLSRAEKVAVMRAAVARARELQP